MKKVYVTGSSGLVGSRFVELYPQKYNLFTPDYPQVDITEKGDIEKIIKKENPDVIIHLAAYTNVSEGEKQKGDKNGDCWRINVEGTKNLLISINPNKTHFIYISTDMVFGGSAEDPGPYSEDHLPEPDSFKMTWYGYAKAQAEREVKKYLGGNSTIVRIIYPVRAKYDLKMDYLAKPLSLFDRGRLYPLFDDQQISIAFIDEIATALDKIIERSLKGIFHVGSSDTTTPFKLISYMIEKARGKKNAVKPASLKEFLKKVDNPVRYPMFGGLKVDKTEERLGFKFRTSKEIVDEIVRQLAIS